MLVAATSANTAHAARVHKGVAAPSMYYQLVTIPPFAGERSWSTVELSAGADTVMHLWDPVTRTEVDFNDDHAGLGSLVSAVNDGPDDRILLLMVRSYSTQTQGTAVLLENGFPIATQIPVGGTLIEVVNEPGDQHETARSSIAAIDPHLLALDAEGHLVDFDWMNGVGDQARVSHPQTTHVVVGTLGAGGLADLYSNDAQNDHDGDGLGAQLEGELSTCDKAVWYHCVDVHNLQDTDRDGLSDSAEVFGIDDVQHPQHLPAWGADPRHKDVFVEIDWSSSFAGQPFTETAAVDVQALFDEGHASDLMNPDGLDGVRLHLDAGFTAAAPDNRTLIGNWGGANVVPAGTSYDEAPDDHRVAAREGIFRYALLNPGAGGGQAASSPGDRFHWTGSVGDPEPQTFAHELGHTLGLGHWGHEQWGAVNGKPNYYSIMNYAYSGAGFSQGDNDVVLNPSQVYEPSGAGIPGDLLEDDPYYRLVGPNDEVDWDFDAHYSGTQEFVRAPVTFATWESTAALSKNRQDLHTEPDLPATTPSLVRGPGDRLYAFYVDDGRIYYRHALMDGSMADGACPGGSEIGDECTTWSAAIEVPTDADARGVTALGGEEQVLLAFRTEYDSLRTIVSNGVVAGGTLADWGGEAYRGVSTDREPEVDWMRVDPELFDGHDLVVGLFYREKASGAYHWLTMTNPAAEDATHRGAMRDELDNVIEGQESPTFTAWPYDPMSSEQGTICGALTAKGGDIRLHCYDRVHNRFEDLTSVAFTDAVTPTTVGKPGLAFRAYRYSSGLPQAGQESRGAFWLSAVIAGPAYDRVIVWISDPVSELEEEPLSDIHFPSLRRGKFHNKWMNAVDGSGMALYDDPQLGALKSLWLSDATSDQSTDPEEQTRIVRFQPFADGTFRAELTDGNDFQVMERGICRGLASADYCGPSSFGLD